MSAPAALAMAKLSYPEMEVSTTKTEEDVYIEKWFVHCNDLLYDIAFLRLRILWEYENQALHI